MSPTTATRVSPKAQGPWSPSTARGKSTTTPVGFPVRTPGSAGQRWTGSVSKGLSPHGRSPLRASSPNYFDFLAEPDSNPPNSNAGIHAKKNWSPPVDGERPPTATSPENYPLENQKRFEGFRRESETNVFRLNQESLRQFSTGSVTRISPTTGRGVENNGDPKPRSGLPANQKPEADALEGDKMDIDPLERIPDRLEDVPRRPVDSNSFFGNERRDSPANDLTLDLSNLRRNQLSHTDERHPRNSLPHNRADPILQHPVQRSETLPSTLNSGGPTMISADELAVLLKENPLEEVLLLDLRVYPQFSKSRITSALNLCIPTTLLKRASFNIQKLAETFTKESERVKFNQWPNVKAIAVYDASSNQLQDATSCVNILKKFTAEQWEGGTFVLRGGFSLFSKRYADQIDKRPAAEMDGSNMKGLSIDPPKSAPVAGGCAMPATQGAANPFFGTIRQNMDLIDGVGQMPVTLPAALKNKSTDLLPDWLRKISDVDNKGKTVADHFLNIERAEEQRMKKALSVNVSYGSPNPMSPNNVQVAGIEKGLKNRYKDILPYDHSRVKLQGVPSGDCDYVNASHIQAHGSNKRYIASQAPVPATFQVSCSFLPLILSKRLNHRKDFWRVVWEQDARVIMMLTAETEGGNRKSHPYWVPGTYGPFKVKSLSERKASLERKDSSKPNRSFTSPLKINNLDEPRPSMARRHSSKHSISSPPAGSSKTFSLSSSQQPFPVDPDQPHVIIRKVALTNTNAPFEPLREITQLQYSSWPDFGAPAHPAHVLGLVERCGEVVRSYEQKTKSQADEPADAGERPVVVHCSAGCGRTGTFCTIDSVIDMLKRQRSHRRQHRGSAGSLRAPSPEDNGVHDAMDVDPPTSTSTLQQPESKDTESWLHHDDVDLVGRTVADFRLQRLSMVQTLRQFVLCYESVLEWIAGEVEGGRARGWG